MFSIKLESDMYSIDSVDTTSNKSQFLLNFHLNQLIELENQPISAEQRADDLYSYFASIKEKYDNPWLFEYDKQHLFIENSFLENYFKTTIIPLITGTDSQSMPLQYNRHAEKYAQTFLSFAAVPEHFFRSATEIALPAREDSLFPGIDQVFQCINDYKKAGEYDPESLDFPFIRCEYGNLSHGEEAFFRFFSSILKSIRSTPKEDNNAYDTKILLLDEPDLSMHPEWSRRFLYDMTRLLSRLYVKKRTAFQIIVATHSPFMVSDVPKENIICLERMEDGSISVRPSKYGLLSNIHDICSDSFFLHSPFGELGSHIFNMLMKRINSLQYIQSPDIPHIQACISEIGDVVIKGHLNMQLHNRLQELTNEKYKTNDEV